MLCMTPFTMQPPSAVRLGRSYAHSCTLVCCDYPPLACKAAPALWCAAAVHQLQAEECGSAPLAPDDLQVPEHNRGRPVCLCDQDALAAPPQCLQG